MVRARKSFSILMVLAAALSLGLLTALLPRQVNAAEFHGTTAAEFQTALDAAEINGEDDTIYLAAGTYQGNFRYAPPDTEHKSLTIMAEPGTTTQDVILDGQNSSRVLWFDDYSDGPVAEVTVNGITVENGNIAYSGGGVYASLDRYNISVTNCIIRNNTAGPYGGGICLYSYENLTLEDNLILDNTVTGGALHEGRGGGAAMLLRSNDTNGGGIAMLIQGGSCTIRNNIIAGNSAQGTTTAEGGGLWVAWADTILIDLIGNTICDNQATDLGGGVYFYDADTASVYNNIIYGNAATHGGDICFRSVSRRIGYNNDYSNMDGDWTDSGSNLDADPAFVDPTNDDYHLTPGSPCIDAGTTDVPEPPGLPDTDIEGNPRVSGAAPDMGAYEFAGRKGDFTGDGHIDIFDFVLFAVAYGSELGDDNFNPIGDFDDDDDIDIYDFVNFAAAYGT